MILYFSGVNPVKMLLKDPELAWHFYLNSGSGYVFTKLTKKRIRYPYYGGKKVENAKYANQYLAEKINEGAPFMAGRLGSAELSYMAETLLYNNKYINDIRTDRLKITCINCGFFPIEKKAFYDFGHLMFDSMKICDLNGISYNIMEAYMCKYFMEQNSKLTHRYMFDFWNYKHPFTEALKGKKVLVIHPFEDTIKSQYEKRDKLFNNPNILPEFTLKTLKAVQTAGGAEDLRFKTWFEALDYMYNEAIKIDFDVAIIGCGAYGFPLAAKLKKAGKIAIHMGGTTQVLFGIKGSRWDKHPVASKLYNDYWVRPSASDTPKDANKVENACYW